MIKKRLNSFEVEQLLMEIFSISDAEYEKVDFEELVNEKYKDSSEHMMSFENLELVLNSLLPYVMASKSELTESVYVGFVDHKNRNFLAKAEATEQEVKDIYGE